MTLPKPLHGLRVVEFAQFIAGPTAAQLLADFGAEIIKVETARGDGTRHLPGTVFGSVYSRSFNTSKSSVVIDTRDASGRLQLDKLLSDSHALLCNVAPGALRRLDLDADGIRRRFPHLVATLISGYGQQDDRSCMDTIAQCESGFAWLNGAEDGTPRISTSWPTDFFSGHYAAMSTAMALLDKNRKGGIIIDISMMEVAAAALLGPAALLISEAGTPPAPTGNRDRASSPSGIYACRDGYIYIYAGLDPYWAKLRPVVDGRDATFAERMDAVAEFDGYVSQWTAARSKDEVLAEMARLAIPAGPVRHPVDSVAMIRALRPGAISNSLPSGEHIPVFPALFDGERIERAAAPEIGGKARRPDGSGEAKP